MFAACTGSDGGGSIRIPSSYSGLPGLKTTFGLIGVGPEPFDTGLTSVHGPMVRSVRDPARYVDARRSDAVRPDVLAEPPPFEPLTTSLDAARERLRGSARRGPRRSATASATPGSRRSRSRLRSSWSRKPDLELVDLDVVLPKPGPRGPSQRAEPRGVGVRRREGPARRSRPAPPRLGGRTAAPRADHLGRAVRRAPGAAQRDSGRLRRHRLLLTPTTATTAYVAEVS